MLKTLMNPSFCKNSMVSGKKSLLVLYWSPSFGAFVSIAIRLQAGIKGSSIIVIKGKKSKIRLFLWGWFGNGGSKEGVRSLDCHASLAMTGVGSLDCRASLAMTGGMPLDCHASLAMMGVRSVDCHASLAMTGVRSLDCQASLAMTGVRSLDCHASLAMMGVRSLGCQVSLAMTGVRSLDCHASLVMTGVKGGKMEDFRVFFDFLLTSV